MPVVGTYSSPSASDRDWVRFIVQDTGVDTDFDLSDTEITDLLAEHTNRIESAVAAQQRLCQKYILIAMRAGESGSIIGEIRRTCESQVQWIRQNGLNITAISPYLPSRSISDKDATLDDSDRVPPRFSRGQHEMTDPVSAEDEDGNL